MIDSDIKPHLTVHFSRAGEDHACHNSATNEEPRMIENSVSQNPVPESLKSCKEKSKYFTKLGYCLFKGPPNEFKELFLFNCYGSFYYLGMHFSFDETETFYFRIDLS